jgi:hypothetical protein
VLLVVLFKVPEISAALVALDAPVSPPVTEGAAQKYNVPGGTIPLVVLAGVTEKDAPLQLAAVMALIAAKGLTVRVRLKAAPLQISDSGDTV